MDRRDDGEPAAVLPGTQEDTITRLTFWAAGQIVMGRMDYDIALSTLWLWARQLPQGDPADPWTEQHVQDRLDRARKKRENEFPITMGGATRDDRSSGGSSGKREITDEQAIALVVAACRSAKVRSLEQAPTSLATARDPAGVRDLGGANKLQGWCIPSMLLMRDARTNSRAGDQDDERDGGREQRGGVGVPGVGGGP